MPEAIENCSSKVEARGNKGAEYKGGKVGSLTDEQSPVTVTQSCLTWAHQSKGRWQGNVVVMNMAVILSGPTHQAGRLIPQARYAPDSEVIGRRNDSLYFQRLLTIKTAQFRQSAVHVVHAQQRSVGGSSIPEGHVVLPRLK